MSIGLHSDGFLGIDIGTSSVKAVLFRQDGSVRCTGSQSYELLSGPEGRVELDPDTVVDAVALAVGRCMDLSGFQPTSVAAVGLSCQHHSLMAVDGAGNPLTRLMTWADNRAVPEALELERMPGVEALYHRTGCRVQHPMYPLAKLLWLKRAEPSIFRNAAKFVTIKEYLLYRMYGEWVVDDTLASAQGFYDIHRHQWDLELVEGLIGISADRLGSVVPCMHTRTGMKPEWAKRFHLNENTPFVVGSGDGIMANLGSGVLNRTVFSSTIGTSGAIRTTVDAPLTDPEGRTWCYAFTRDKWVAGGAINNGSIAMSWLRREFGLQYGEHVREGESLSKTMDRLASAIPPGSGGLVFLPYLLGERCPDWNANARGMMAGLDFSHTRAHLVRAFMEGVMYRMATVDDALSELVGGGGALRASGGYARSDFWLQMQADLFNREVQISDVSEAGALGAAYLAMVAVGAVPNLEGGLPAMTPTRFFHPNPETACFYAAWKKRAESLYQALSHF